MRVYADTSFLVRLVTDEPGSETAMAEYRRIGFPGLFFLPLHDLEVTNAVRQRVFHLRHGGGKSRRSELVRERDAALSRIERWIGRGWLIETAADWEDGLKRAKTLSELHTERLGCRGFDLLHVAFALELECEVFLTSDRIQGTLARAGGLDATVTTAD